MVQAVSQNQSSREASSDYGRPASIEEFSNRKFIHPLSDAVVRLGIRWKISANAVSLLGLICGLAAAVAYFQTPNQLFVVFGFLLMICWHVFDGADGRLARATGTTSAFGRIIDGICDHLVYAAVYISLAVNLMAAGYPASIWWLVVGAGVSHAVQAAGYEERRQKFQRRRAGLDRVDTAANVLDVNGRRSVIATLYDGAQKLVAGGDYGLDDQLARLRKGRSNQRLADLIVESSIPMVKAWSLLNANNRTALIFVFCLVGEPLLYFAFELIVLNFALLVLLFAEWRFEKKLVNSINMSDAL